MSLTILYPDAVFDGAPDIEERALGGVGSVVLHRAREAVQIPDAVWRTADAVVCYDGFPIDRAVVDRLDRCRLIVRAGVGFDHIDGQACRARGIPLCNTPDYGTGDVADHAIALMLALSRSVVAYDRALGERGAAGWAFARTPPPIRLAGRIFGVIGLGRIGIATALRAKAFGMPVCFHDPYVANGLEISLGLDRAPTLDDLLARSDIVSLHVPLTGETSGMIGERALDRMKATASLINTSRGAVVDTDALLAALRAGRLASAALDVLPVEPPGADDRLLAAWRANAESLRDRLILTPHAAFYSLESIVDLRRKSAETVRTYLQGGGPANCVNQDPVRKQMD